MSRWMSLVIIKLVYIMPIVNLKSPFAIVPDEHESGSNTDVLEHSLSLAADGLLSAKARNRGAGIPAIRVSCAKKSAHPWG
jgi:hypothetical protein